MSLQVPYAPQKLQKVLATEGLGSRREIEGWIKEGRLRVNGVVAALGVRVKAQDKIMKDDQELRLSYHRSDQVETRILLYYKPYNEICSAKDPEGRKTVFEQLPTIRSNRWVMVGRLDFNTVGLLLFTTNGLLSHRLLHPSYEIEREYAVRAHGVLTSSMIERLKKGVLLDGKMARFISITSKNESTGANHWYHVILKEGRQREVRRLFESQGVIVNRLMRIRFGPIVLPKQLYPGQSIELERADVRQLKQCVGL